MQSTLLPFLYQTRTLGRALGTPSVFNFTRLAHSLRKPQAQKPDNSIPFIWDSAESPGDIADGPARVSTITPSEAQIFKGIFDEIAQGKMTPARKRSSASQADFQDATTPGSEVDRSSSGSKPSGMARSIVEQARVTEFREKFLRRYPQSLQNAAQIALGLYELKPGETDSRKGRFIETDEDDKRTRRERAKYDLARTKELERVESLMNSCETDEALWRVLEKEVFSLPAKLGIMQDTAKPSESKKSKAASRKETESEESAAENGEDEKRIMDVHGPLYSQFISTALGLFETAFAHPSPYVFQILPRVKELGLPSYVLGVSTPFYSRLAKIYWQRFGDANSALDILQEMNSVGLYADKDVTELLGAIRDNLHNCTWGAQGQFVMAMMESPPYDSGLMQRLDGMEEAMRQSLYEAGGYAPR
ncbi:hypothetical protein PT974_06515 [Cladobotryum mycophilum]|uniref:Mtf2-like C-terminal domain-containing protein n=1 Tax=Cladobotryum mycophilum TaxID=491253 RepID=A0ABR0SLS5_9HYPO